MALRDHVNQAARRVPKWAVYLAGTLPLWWLIFALFTGGLGIDPVKRLEHELGKLGLQFLVATLAVTPLLRHARINLVKFRRVLGLLTFLYISLHLMTWLLLDMQLLWAQILKDLTKRPYIIIGMVAFALMLPLAITSNDLALRRLGTASWRRLHRLVYAIAVLGPLHYAMVVKGFQIEPLVYLAVVSALLALRLPIRRFQRMAWAARPAPRS